MTPVRRNNQEWLPSIFSDFFDNDWMPRMNATTPAVNVIENETEYKVEVAAPGMTKEDFCVHLADENQLVISMEKKNETKSSDNSKYLRREFSYSNYDQTYVLPDDVDRNKISAKVADGVLTVVIPKEVKEEQKTLKNIEVK